ncbi:MAG: ATP-binding cassette domain-containing protein, partial [Phycisphaerales bacterium]
MIKTSPPSSPSEASNSTVADLRGISKTYFKPDGSVLVEALRSIDLRIDTGQYMAIMGASGSGKSTILRHMI